MSLKSAQRERVDAVYKEMCVGGGGGVAGMFGKAVQDALGGEGTRGGAAVGGTEVVEGCVCAC